MRGLEKIYGEGTDRHTYIHTHTHFNTVNRPGLRAGSIENPVILMTNLVIFRTNPFQLKLKTFFVLNGFQLLT